MRISDWSSDVCSSDLRAAAGAEIEQLEIARADGRSVARGRLQHRQVAKAITPEISGRRVVLTGVAADHQGREIARSRSEGGGVGKECVSWWRMWGSPAL